MTVIPELKKVPYDGAVIDKAIQDAQKKQLTKITIPMKKRGTVDESSIPTTSFHILKSLPSVMDSKFFELARSVAVVEAEHGIFLVDDTLLKAAVHMFILENLSTLSVPKRGESETFEVSEVLALGDYLVEYSAPYNTLFTGMLDRAYDECCFYAEEINSLAAQMISGSVESAEILKDPEVLKQVIDLAKNVTGTDA